MDTNEHRDIGDAITVKLRDNPYLALNENKTSLTMMSLINGIPQPLDTLKLTLGEIVAMPDYFTDPDWNVKLQLESCQKYSSVEDLGKELIRREVSDGEEKALLDALHDLANPKRKRSSVDTVFKIASASYFPVKSVNDLIQQVMYYFRVKHYDKKLDKNQTHFTPWSVRVYTIGHTMALDYAQTAYQLKKLAQEPSFRSDNPFYLKTVNHLVDHNQLTPELLQAFAHRYHAMSFEIEMYTAHYLSDHFAAGHMSLVGDLRVEFPEKFGFLGGIAVNTMHNELNRISVYTKKPYDPTPNEKDAPVDAFGDGTFDQCKNAYNKQACIESLQASVADLEAVLDGQQRPDPESYGALSYLPDVDYNYRQPEPMFLYHNKKIWVRGDLKKIRMIGPDDFDQLQQHPKSWGYKEVSGKLQLLYILFKLRVLPFYNTKEIPLSAKDELTIKEQESGRIKERQPIPAPPCGLHVVPELKETAFFEKGGSPYLNYAEKVKGEEASEIPKNMVLN
jgi:hypothetical protein